jgi:lysine 2,3-aminomutase
MLRARVRPSYLFHCDPVLGTGHLRVPLAEALELLGQLIGRTSGMAIPKFALDLRGEGKVPLWPEAIVGGDDEAVLVRGFRGVVQRYPRR